MKLTERDYYYPGHENYAQIMSLCHLSKNLYNAALYDKRQYYFNTGKYKSFEAQKPEFKQNPDYIALPRKVSSSVLQQVDLAFQSFFKLLKLKNGGGYTGKVRLPKYKDKDGVNVLTIPKDAISTKVSKLENSTNEFTLCANSLKLKVYSKHESLDIVRFVPMGNHVVVEKVYSVSDSIVLPDNGRVVGLDPGVNQLALVGNVCQSMLVNMRPVKSVNQYYNSRLAGLRSSLPEGVKTSKRIKELKRKRACKMDWDLHNISNLIVDYLVSNDISMLVIGHNVGWKTRSNMGKRNNQSFVMLPFSRLFDLLSYKCARFGIKVVISEESYSSLASLLDRDVVRVYVRGEVVNKSVFSGRRVKRGLYKTATGAKLNADVNGGGNILRKVVPDAIAYGQGIEGYAMNPMVTTVLHRGIIKCQNVIK